MDDDPRLKWILDSPAPFSLSDLRNAIPSYCFKPSYLKSFSYVLHDCFGVLLFLCINITLSNNVIHINSSISIISQWFVLPFFQGCFMLGLFQIGHDCGHGGFSSNILVNDIIGNFVHTILLWPYYPWKFTHHMHHANVNSLSKNDGFFAAYSSKKQDVKRIVKTKQYRLVTCSKPYYQNILNLILRVILFILMNAFGWFFFLVFDISGRPMHYNNCQKQKQNQFEVVSHFNPFCCMFNNKFKKQVQCFISILFVSGWVYTLIFVFGNMYGAVMMIKLFWLPHMFGTHLLLTVGILQHANERIAKFNDDEWNWLRGSFGTIDNDLGFINYFSHNGSNGHFIHHLFSNIPHYHCIEATKHLLNKFPIIKEKYYIYEKHHLYFVQAWKVFNHFWFVDDWNENDKKNKKGIAFYQTDANKIKHIIKHAAEFYNL